MILRQFISTFLIQAMLITSASAYAPSSAVFLLNEGRRELRCQLTPDNIELFSTEEFQGLIQNNALATVDSPADGLRPCDKDDVFYAQIVFGETSFANVSDPVKIAGAIMIGLMGITAILMIGAIPVAIIKSIENPPTLEEIVETVCGERPALVDEDGIQCLDEEESEEESPAIQ